MYRHTIAESTRWRNRNAGDEEIHWKSSETAGVEHVIGNPDGSAKRAPEEGNTSAITSGLDDNKGFGGAAGGHNVKLPTARGKKRRDELIKFADELMRIDKNTGFKVSSRGWCYQLEGLGLITKGEFSRVQHLINECRKNGILPIDFVAEEDARSFDCVHKPDADSPQNYLKSWIETTLRAGDLYEPDYWSGETYFIQVMVEKTDLVTLFKPVCEKYHIPIATSKGWSSISQRAELASRFEIMEETGHIPVLLYCGDHDPVGLGISDMFMKHLCDIEGGTGWSPDSLIIDRFGLNYDFITENGLTWIDNLVTGSGRPADESNPMVQRYIEKFGRRKCEANAIVVNPAAGRDLCRQAIEKYMGPDVLSRYAKKKQSVLDEFEQIQNEAGVLDPLHDALNTLRGA